MGVTADYGGGRRIEGEMGNTNGGAIGLPREG